MKFAIPILMLIHINAFFKTRLRSSTNRCTYRYMVANYQSTFGGTRGDLQNRVAKALDLAFGEGIVDSSTTLVVPTQPIHGDYQSNVAMSLTNKLKMKPRMIADKIVEALKVDDIVSTINITGPGFITMKLSDEYIQIQLAEKFNDQHRLGIKKLSNPQRIIVDFSSPNIAKEMHVVSITYQMYAYINLR